MKKMLSNKINDIEQDIAYYTQRVKFLGELRRNYGMNTTDDIRIARNKVSHLKEKKKRYAAWAKMIKEIHSEMSRNNVTLKDI